MNVNSVKTIVSALIIMVLGFLLGCSSNLDPYETKPLSGLTFGTIEITGDEADSCRVALQSALLKSGAEIDEKCPNKLVGTCKVVKGKNSSIDKITISVESMSPKFSSLASCSPSMSAITLEYGLTTCAKWIAIDFSQQRKQKQEEFDGLIPTLVGK